MPRNSRKLIDRFRSLKGQNAFPDPARAHLLNAALGRGDVAAHWRAFCDARCGAMFDEGERRIFPLVARQLESRDAVLKRDKILTILRNEVMLNAARNFRIQVKAKGLDMVLLKGLALMMRVYRDVGMRASTDVDCYFPANQSATILDIMHASGCTNTASGRRNEDHDASNLFATTFDTPTGERIDLHWFPRRVFGCDAASIGQFEAMVQNVEFENENWKIPSDTWLLLETIDHGVKHSPVAPIRWITDGVNLINLPDSRIDWPLFLEKVRDARIELLAGLGLVELARFGAAIPDEVIGTLMDHRPGYLERMEARNRLRRRGAVLPLLLDEFFMVMRRTPGPVSRRLLGFPGHLITVRYEQDSLWGFVTYAINAKRRMRRRNE